MSKNMYLKMKLPSTKTVISAAASVAATTMLFRSITRDFLPLELRRHLGTKFYNYYTTFTNEMTITIYEFEGLVKNQLFCSAEIYLATIVSPSIKRFRALVPEKETKIHFSVEDDEDLTDQFSGFQLKWRSVRKETKPRYVPGPEESRSTMSTELKYLELTFNKKHKSRVFDEYLPYILERSKDLKDERKTLRLHTLRNDGSRIQIQWQAVNLDHSATFDTLAMDDATKKMIVGDLDRFLKRKEYYKKVGKAWKRGYLLFGPPGTGKSSLIAAMATYLNFDVYDLELTDVKSNSDLRRLLIRTANRSILVVEDIDASIDLSGRKAIIPKPTYSPHHYQHSEEPKVTLSGLLNFTDGLWSSCGDERIIVFTTNHKEKLDPALLRPGRMDVHIHMSYCTPEGFRMLISNYLGIEDHPQALKAEGMIEETNVTPAEVAEQLLKNDDPEQTLQNLIEFLENKKVSEKERLEKEILEAPDVEVAKIELNVPFKEVKKVEMGDGSGLQKYCKQQDGLEELIKKDKASLDDVREQVLKIYEAVNALKKLMGIIGGEKGLEYIKHSDSVVQSSGALITPKISEKNEIKAE